jgi:hypothetical protein
MLPYVVFLLALPVLIIWSADITFQPRGRYLFGSLQLIAVAFGIALACLYLQYSAILRAGNVSNKYIVYSLVPLNIISSSINATSKAVKPYLQRTRQEPEIARASGRRATSWWSLRWRVFARELQSLRLPAAERIRCWSGSPDSICSTRSRRAARRCMRCRRSWKG